MSHTCVFILFICFCVFLLLWSVKTAKKYNATFAYILSFLVVLLWFLIFLNFYDIHIFLSAYSDSIVCESVFVVRWRQAARFSWVSFIVCLCCLVLCVERCCTVERLDWIVGSNSWHCVDDCVWLKSGWRKLAEFQQQGDHSPWKVRGCQRN